MTGWRDVVVGSYETTAKASRKLAGSGEWNTDDGVIVHAVQYGMTVCGIEIGRERQGWLGPLWYLNRVSCKRCIRIIGGSLEVEP